MLNGLTLAYIGDAVYEVEIRTYLINKGLTKVKDLHNQAIKYTQATSQALAAYKLIDYFYTKEEITIYKRGRNQSASHKPKNTDVNTYNKSTGFEAVLGQLYLEGNLSRLNDIIKESIKVIDEFVEL
ncbi:MAG: ribonuclease III [Candidatus Izimaplasma sp.]|nr:ribonuclease III [Candidatus Izimaplasma bacterium]